MSSPARRLLLPGFFAVATPSPTPSAAPMDSATLGEQQLAYFEQLGTSIKLAGLHAFVFTLHALLLAAEVAAAAGVVVLIGRIATPHVRRAINRRAVTGLRILPSTDARFQPEAWLACFRALYSIATPWWKSWLTGQPAVVFEYRAEDARVSTHCWFPAELVHTVSNALTRAMPGVELRAEIEGEVPRPPRARARLRLWRDPPYPLGAPHVDALASAVAALAECDGGLLQVSVAPDTGWERRAARRLKQLSGDGPAMPLAIRILIKLLILPFDLFFEIFWSSSSTRTHYEPAPPPRQKPIRRRVPDEKAYQACWRVDVRMCSYGHDVPDGLRPVAAAFQALDGENRLRQKRVWFRPGFDESVRKRLGPAGSNLVLTAAELTQICHLPLAGVSMDSAHVRVGPTHALNHQGSSLARLEDPKGTPIHIAQVDRRQHLWAEGPTGSGKSTLLLNLALQDVEAGIGVGVVDPKGDLIRDLLERIPTAQQHRLVLFDPAERDRPLGLNVLECEKVDERELVTDSVVSIFRKTYERFWGPRTDDILRAAVLTLLRHPGTTLCDVPLLLIDREVRARLTKHLDDPIGLRPFWQEYEGFAEGQRAQMVGPVLNKLRSFLLRPTVRNVLGQSRSTLDLAEVMDHGGILLVNLSKGALGEESSRLLGSFVVSRLWQAALGRATRPESWRPDFNLYLDEFQNYLHLPQSLDDVLAESRAYRLSLTLANQHLGQLREATRQAVQANTRTKVVFQLSQDDARQLVGEFSPLTETQLQTLGRHQVAISLCVNGPHRSGVHSAYPARAADLGSGPCNHPRRTKSQPPWSPANGGRGRDSGAARQPRFPWRLQGDRVTEMASCSPSRPELAHTSRRPSRPGVNPLSSSNRLDFSSGLSIHIERRPHRILELNREEAHHSKDDVEPTNRDLTILQELDSHRYLDRNQIQALFFPGPRNCQYRLQWLLDHGLLTRWRAATRPGRVCRASIYVAARRGAALLAEWRDQDPRPFIKRAENALARRFHLMHQLEANQFFVSLASSLRNSSDLGLYHWVGEHEIAAAYAESNEQGPTPDGWGRALTSDREVLIHLEWDRGTEQPRRLRAKLQAYVRYFIDRPHASANQVLWVVPSRAREEQLARLLCDLAEPDRECCRFWITTSDLLDVAGPLAAVWSDGSSEARRPLVTMPGLARSHRRVEDCIGKPDWWLRRPAGGAGA